MTREIHKLRDSYEITTKDLLKDIPGMVSITTDAWSSQMYRGYLSLTLHWVDKEWVLRHVLLDFVRFPKPHNGTTNSSILMELLTHWNLTSKLRAVTTDNASDICSAMEKLLDMLNIRNNTSTVITNFHVRCIAHVVHLAVGECLKDIHGNVSLSWSLLSAIRWSIKRRDIYEKTQKQLEITVSLSCLDVLTRWSSTFNMIRNVTKARPILDSMTAKVPDLRAFAISNEIRNIKRILQYQMKFGSAWY